MNEIKLDYFLERMCEERDAVTKAASEEAKQAHQQLAARYEEVLVAFDHPAITGDGDPCDEVPKADNDPIA